jgi:hypothetical protein
VKKFSIGSAAVALAVVTLVMMIAPMLAPLYAAPVGTTTPEDASGLACAACAGIFMIVPLIYIVLSLIVGVWMYRDAQRRNNPQAVLWLILGIVFNLAALLIYLAVRKNQQLPPPPM